MMKLDLLLGSDIGSWALERVAIDQIEQVITLDEGLAERSRALGLRTILGNVNFVDYVPSQIGFSLHYSAILKPDLIRKYQKIFNLHPGYLPWGGAITRFFGHYGKKRQPGQLFMRLPRVWMRGQ